MVGYCVNCSDLGHIDCTFAQVLTVVLRNIELTLLDCNKIVFVSFLNSNGDTKLDNER